MCRDKDVGVLGAKGSRVGAVQNGVRRVLNVALACCRTVWAQAPLPCQLLPATRLLSQPVGAGAQLCQRAAARPLRHHQQVARQAVAVGAGCCHVLRNPSALRSGELWRKVSVANSSMSATSIFSGCCTFTGAPMLPKAAATCPAHGCCASGAPPISAASAQLSARARRTRLSSSAASTPFQNRPTCFAQRVTSGSCAVSASTTTIGVDVRTPSRWRRKDSWTRGGTLATCSNELGAPNFNAVRQDSGDHGIKQAQLRGGSLQPQLSAAAAQAMYSAAPRCCTRSSGPREGIAAVELYTQVFECLLDVERGVPAGEGGEGGGHSTGSAGCAAPLPLKHHHLGLGRVDRQTPSSAVRLQMV